jgi:hypothetical protein
VEYVIITLLVIAISAFVFYKLANNVFELPIKLKPLLMCAGCAALLSLVVPRVVINYTGFGGALVILACIAIICAYFIAYYDKFMIKRDIRTSAISDSKPINEASFSYSTEDAIAATETSDVPKSRSTYINIDYKDEVISLAQPVASMQAAKDQAEESQFIIADTTSSVEIIEDLHEETRFIESESESIKDELRTINTESISGEIPENLIKEDSLVELEPELMINDEDEAETIESANNISTKVEWGQHENISTEHQCYVEVQQPNVAEEAIMLAETLPSDNLDELMDYAFQQKELQNFAQAMMAFRKALKLYPKCDAAPFLLVEIGNLKKKAGKFDEAISTFDEGRRIASALNNSVLEKEFIDAIAYLRIVKNTLIQNKIFCTRFEDIPAAVIDEINKEFIEWRNIS